MYGKRCDRQAPKKLPLSVLSGTKVTGCVTRKSILTQGGHASPQTLGAPGVGSALSLEIKER